MADDIDVATALMDNELSRALDKIRQQNAQNTKGTKFCVECGDAMPKERQALGFKLCVSCAEESERRKALFADE